MKMRPGNKKKAAMLLLAAFLVSALTACGDVSFETASVRAVSALTEAENVHADVSVEVAATASILGEELPMSASAAVSMDTDGANASGRISLDAFGTSYAADYASVKSGEGCDLYISLDGGEVWTKQAAVSRDELKESIGSLDPDISSMLEFYVEFAGGFSKPVAETCSGVECLRYDGVLPGDKLSEALSMSGGSALAELTDGTVMPDAPVSRWFAREGFLPVRVSVDMTEAVGRYVTGALAGSWAPEGLVRVDSVTVDVELGGYGESAPEVPGT